MPATRRGENNVAAIVQQTVWPPLGKKDCGRHCAVNNVAAIKRNTFNNLNVDVKRHLWFNKPSINFNSIAGGDFYTRVY